MTATGTSEYTPVQGASPFEAGAADGVLNWDSEIRNEGSEFTLLPDGDYPFTVTKFERQHFAGSAKLPPCSKAALTLELDGGSLGRTTVTHNLFLHARCEWMLCAFFESIGQRRHGEALRPRWNEVTGAKGVCRVKVTDYESKKYGETRQKNEITKFLPPPAKAAPEDSVQQSMVPPKASKWAWGQ